MYSIIRRIQKKLNDSIKTKPSSKEYKENWDRVFGTKEPEQLSLDLLYEEIGKEGNSQETKPAHCFNWVLGWNPITEENNND